MARYARGMWDFQLAKYGYTRRVNGLASTPATIPVSRFKSASKDLAIPLTAAWYDFVQQVNPPESRRLITAPRTGWVNAPWEPEIEYPSAETLIMAGNVVLVPEVDDKFARIEAFDFFGDVPDAATDNFTSKPWLVHKFTVIAGRNVIRNPGAGLDAYYPVLRNADAFWVALDRIEFFPELPMAVRIEVPTVVSRQWDTPSDMVLPAGVTREVREYKVTGCSVWGAIDEGWIPLSINGTFAPTSWKMNTPPPIAPKGAADNDDFPDPTTDGQYEVKIAIIRMIVRQGPGGNKVGEMVYGRKARVFQEVRFQGQPWLRIGDKRWIPNAGTTRLEPA